MSNTPAAEMILKALKEFRNNVQDSARDMFHTPEQYRETKYAFYTSDRFSHIPIEKISLPLSILECEFHCIIAS